MAIRVSHGGSPAIAGAVGFDAGYRGGLVKGREIRRKAKEAKDRLILNIMAQSAQRSEQLIKRRNREQQQALSNSLALRDQALQEQRFFDNRAAGREQPAPAAGGGPAAPLIPAAGGGALPGGGGGGGGASSPLPEFSSFPPGGVGGGSGAVGGGFPAAPQATGGGGMIFGGAAPQGGGPAYADLASGGMRGTVSDQLAPAVAPTPKTGGGGATGAGPAAAESSTVPGGPVAPKAVGVAGEGKAPPVVPQTTPAADIVERPDFSEFDPGEQEAYLRQNAADIDKAVGALNQSYSRMTPAGRRKFDQLQQRLAGLNDARMGGSGTGGAAIDDNTYLREKAKVGQDMRNFRWQDNYVSKGSQPGDVITDPKSGMLMQRNKKGELESVGMDPDWLAEKGTRPSSTLPGMHWVNDGKEWKLHNEWELQGVDPVGPLDIQKAITEAATAWKNAQPRPLDGIEVPEKPVPMDQIRAEVLETFKQSMTAAMELQDFIAGGEERDAAARRVKRFGETATPERLQQIMQMTPEQLTIAAAKMGDPRARAALDKVMPRQLKSGAGDYVRMGPVGGREGPMQHRELPAMSQQKRQDMYRRRLGPSFAESRAAAQPQPQRAAPAASSLEPMPEPQSEPSPSNRLDLNNLRPDRSMLQSANVEAFWSQNPDMAKHRQFKERMTSKYPTREAFDKNATNAEKRMMDLITRMIKQRQGR